MTDEKLIVGFGRLLLEVLNQADQFRVYEDYEYRGTLVGFGVFSYRVKAGFVTDLASIPRVLRRLVNRNGKSRKAAVIHDHMYTVKWKTRKSCDKAFYQLLLLLGVPRWKAYTLFYLGVRLGGWTRGRW